MTSSFAHSGSGDLKGATGGLIRQCETPDTGSVAHAASDSPRERRRSIVLTVIAPCFNEQHNIAPLVARTLVTFDSLGVEAELLLIDDRSADGTWAAIHRATQADSRVRGIRHDRNRGMVAGWRSGLSAARGGLACLIDADLQNRPESIVDLYSAHRRGQADVIQGVRHATDPGERFRVFTRGLNILLNTAFGTRLRDNKSGFILCSREALEAILRHRYTYRYFQCFVGVAAIQRGLRIAEVNTPFDRRHAGDSFLPRFPWRSTLRILWEVVKFRVELRRERRIGASSTPPCRGGAEGRPLEPELSCTRA